MTDRRYWLDLAERALATYVEALLGLLIASAATDLVDLAAWQAAAVAAVPAGLAVVKAGLARMVGDPDTAALTSGAAAEDDLLDDDDTWQAASEREDQS